MKTDIPDYRLKQLAEALSAYGFLMDQNNYSLKDYVSASPEKFYYFFISIDSPDTVLVLLTEDYISGLDYVKSSFNEELDAELVELHRVVNYPHEETFEERSPVKTTTVYKKPDNWNELAQYAVDFSPYDFGFLATVKPIDIGLFWNQLRDRIESM